MKVLKEKKDNLAKKDRTLISDLKSEFTDFQQSISPIKVNHIIEPKVENNNSLPQQNSKDNFWEDVNQQKEKSKENSQTSLINNKLSPEIDRLKQLSHIREVISSPTEIYETEKKKIVKENLHSEMLFKRAKIHNEKRNNIYEANLKQKEQKELGECSFKPQLNNYSSQIVEKSVTLDTGSIYNFKEDVYERNKNWHNKKRIKHSNMKNVSKQDYTFKPVLQTEAKLDYFSKQNVISDDYSLNIFYSRLKNARKGPSQHNYLSVEKVRVKSDIKGSNYNDKIENLRTVLNS